MTRPIADLPVVVRKDPPASGVENMAVDEAMLATATPDSPITLRLYQWETATLSLGYFQTIEDGCSDPKAENFPLIEQIPRVRRKTGGGAIIHDQEWTYSIVIPAAAKPASKGHSEHLYRAVHESVRDGLLDLGWDARLWENCSCSSEKRDRDEAFLCFQRRSPVDVVVGDFKILGSAQRRHRAGLLQHGSLLLRHASVYPALWGLEQLPRRLQKPVDWAEWLEHSIRRGLRRGLGVDC